jgi:hypothetical protein
MSMSTWQTCVTRTIYVPDRTGVTVEVAGVTAGWAMATSPSNIVVAASRMILKFTTHPLLCLVVHGPNL